MDEEIIRVRGTIVGYERLIKSLIWRDLKDEIGRWKEAQNAMFQSATTMEEVARIQGRLEAMAYMEQLPEVILEGLNNSNNNDEEEN